MKHKTMVTLTLMAAAALAFEPSAQAGQAVTGTAAAAAGKTQGHTQGTMQQGQLNSRMITNSGLSVTYLLHHGYAEAAHGNESLAVGMNEMARNHFDNVRIVLSQIDVNQNVAESGLRSRITALRDRAGDLATTPGAQGGTQLVNDFAALIAAMPSARGGGGGGGGPMTPMMHLPVELAAKAASSAVAIQLDAAQRDFKGANLHAQHTVASLEMALASARGHKMGASQISNLTVLLNQAKQVQKQVASGSAQSVASAGKLVNSVGSYLPALKPSMGGGAGSGMTSPEGTP